MKTIKLLIAWTWIAVPLSWGVYQSVQKSLPLFQGEATPGATGEQVETTDAANARRD